MKMTTQLKHILLGLPEEIQELEGLDLRLQNPFDPWTFIFLALAVTAFAGYLYTHTDNRIPRIRRLVMAALRVLLILLVLVVMQKPVLDAYIENKVRGTLLIGLDASGSIRIEDQRHLQEDLVRAAIALGDLSALNGLDQPLPKPAEHYNAVSRERIINGMFSHPDFPLVEKLAESYDLTFFTIGELAAEIGNPYRSLLEEEPETGEGRAQVWNATQRRTALGTSIREMLERERGRSLIGMFLLTDGANNAGFPPLSAATMAAEEDLPLFFFGSGVTTPRDIVLQRLSGPSVVIKEDPVSLNVRLRGRGFEDEEVTLKLLKNGMPISEKSLVLTGGEQTTQLTFVPDEIGDMELTARIEPRPGETLDDNNETSHSLQVIDSRFNVLFAEHLPRWEFRYLLANLTRDSRIKADVYLHEGGLTFAGDEDSPFVDRFPATREALFHYHVIILGDISADTLGAATMSNLAEWVSQFGGSLVLLSGRAHNPWTYGNTALAPLFPVEFPDRIPHPNPNFYRNPALLTLTPGGERSELLNMFEEDGLSPGADKDPIWERLPPLEWVAAVTRAKPAAEVLAIDPSTLRETRHGHLPLIARQSYGLGTVLYFGSDNFWRWRSFQEPGIGDFHRQFWSRVVQQMAMSKFLSSSSLTNLSFAENRYVVGDRIRVMGRLFEPGYEPTTDATVPAQIGFTPEDSQTETVSSLNLRQLRGQPGQFQGEFPAAAAGTYRVYLERDPEEDVRTPVTEPRFEMGETDMNENLMRRMAEISGGKFFREENLYELPDLLSEREEMVRTPMEISLWASPFVFLLFLLLATGEWLTRKLSGLR
jgi:hypothetical protein